MNIPIPRLVWHWPDDSIASKEHVVDSFSLFLSTETDLPVGLMRSAHLTPRSSSAARLSHTSELGTYFLIHNLQINLIWAWATLNTLQQFTYLTESVIYDFPNRNFFCSQCIDVFGLLTHHSQWSINQCLFHQTHCVHQHWEHQTSILRNRNRSWQALASLQIFWRFKHFFQMPVTDTNCLSPVFETFHYFSTRLHKVWTTLFDDWMQASTSAMNPVVAIMNASVPKPFPCKLLWQVDKVNNVTRVSLDFAKY